MSFQCPHVSLTLLRWPDAEAPACTFVPAVGGSSRDYRVVQTTASIFTQCYENQALTQVKIDILSRGLQFFHLKICVLLIKESGIFFSHVTMLYSVMVDGLSIDTRRICD